MKNAIKITVSIAALSFMGYCAKEIHYVASGQDLEDSRARYEAQVEYETSYEGFRASEYSSPEEYCLYLEKHGPTATKKCALNLSKALDRFVYVFPTYKYPGP